MNAINIFNRRMHEKNNRASSQIKPPKIIEENLMKLRELRAEAVQWYCEVSKHASSQI